MAEILYEDIKPGDQATMFRKVNSKMIDDFAALSGDYNKAHMDDDGPPRVSTAWMHLAVHLLGRYTLDASALSGIP
jgi:hypothetical protein